MYPLKNPRLSTALVFTMERSRAPGKVAAYEAFPSTGASGVPVPRWESAPPAAIPATPCAAGSVVIDQCLSRIFVAAYLLTGSAKHAERVVAESIQRLDIRATRSGCLSWKAVAAAVTREARELQDSPAAEVCAKLPVELLRVLRLSPILRQCYVLRVLMAMPRQYCAGLLRIDAREVDANASLAARQLASMSNSAPPPLGG